MRVLPHQVKPKKVVASWSASGIPLQEVSARQRDGRTPLNHTSRWRIRRKNACWRRRWFPGRQDIWEAVQKHFSSKPNMIFTLYFLTLQIWRKVWWTLHIYPMSKGIANAATTRFALVWICSKYVYLVMSKLKENVSKHGFCQREYFG